MPVLVGAVVGNRAQRSFVAKHRHPVTGGQADDLGKAFAHVFDLANLFPCRLIGQLIAMLYLMPPRRDMQARHAQQQRPGDVEFPLPGFILCGDCQKPLTSCWSKSKTGKKHPYYLCFTKGCESHRKSIRRDDLESAFEETLQALQPAPSLVDLVTVMFRDAWDQRSAQATEMMATLKGQAKKVDAQIEQLLDRIVDASSDSVIQAYEKRIAKLENEKLLIAERQVKQTKPRRPFDELFELALSFLSSPWNIWKTGDVDLRRTVLRLAFEERIEYSRKTGL